MIVDGLMHISLRFKTLYGLVTRGHCFYVSELLLTCLQYDNIIIVYLLYLSLDNMNSESIRQVVKTVSQNAELFDPSLA